MGDASGCNIVFRIENNNIEIIQCGTHYRDKQKYELKEYSVTADSVVTEHFVYILRI